MVETPPMPPLLRALLFAALALLALPAQALGAVTQLDLTSYADMVVDPTHQHVFVSGGAGNSTIVVLNYSGAVVATILSESGAAGMALDPATDNLYVALESSNGIT
jgi:DNA-binding beta-propeller fold protein YncE